MAPDHIAELVMIDLSRRQREEVERLERWAGVVACAGEPVLARDLMAEARAKREALVGAGPEGPTAVVPPRLRRAA